MKTNNRLILIGGTGRNVGKTEFVCRVIKKFAATHDIYALKVSAVLPSEETFHGDHSQDPSGQPLFEESDATRSKDTSRMLRAGARRVFYLQSGDEHILAGYEQFLELIPENSLIVCESNSLGYHVVPGAHIVVKGDGMSVKPRAEGLLETADLVVISDGKSGFPELESIAINGGRWMVEGLS